MSHLSSFLLALMCAVNQLKADDDLQANFMLSKYSKLFGERLTTTFRSPLTLLQADKESASESRNLKLGCSNYVNGDSLGISKLIIIMHYRTV